MPSSLLQNGPIVVMVRETYSVKYKGCGSVEKCGVPQRIELCPLLLVAAILEWGEIWKLGVLSKATTFPLEQHNPLPCF